MSFGAWKSFKRATSKTVVEVLQAMIEQCNKDKDDAKVYAEALNEMLDGLLEEDFFGTEGQCDPRGDHRS